MNDLPDKSAPTDTPSPQRRGLFDQTWEVELLISGALVFALMGAPARLGAWWDRMSVISAGDLRFAYFFAYYYLSLLAYALIATFVLHIAARAYWVGLAGLHSVYPEGIEWSALTKRGPIGMALAKAVVPPLDRAVRSADGFCRLIFAFAAILVGNLVVSVIGLTAVAVPSYLLATFVFPGASLVIVAAAFFVIVILIPFAGAGLLDRRMRDRIPTDSRLAGVIRLLLRIGYYVGLGPVFHPLMYTISTRTSPRRFAVILQTIGAGVVILFVVGNLRLLSDGGPFDSFLLAPDSPSSAELVSEYYADQRTMGAIYRSAPAIQSEVIDGDYLRLFIPYYPHRDNDLLRERCEAFMTSGADDAGAARCLGDLYELSMNGSGLPPQHYDFATDPGSGMRGVVARIPVGALTPGRHALRLVRVLSADRREEVEAEYAANTDTDRGTLAEAVEDASTVHVIPFWR